jgi:hypothetical protein
MNGSVQLPTSNINNIQNIQPTNQITNSEISLFPVGQKIDSKNFVYNDKTILFINSTVNSNINTVKAQYFNPLDTTNWNFEIQSDNLLNGLHSTSDFLSEDLSTYTNMQQSSVKTLGKYNLDIINSGATLTEFFSLTASPYVSVNGVFESTPTYNNVVPKYSSLGSDSFIFSSNYFVKQKNEILIVYLIFTIQNTSSLDVLNTGTSVPIVSVRVLNKVITKEKMANIATSNNSKTKMYDFGSTTLKYSDNTFDSTTSSFFQFNTFPVVLAPGYQKLYGNISLIYVPPVLNGNNYVGQYLNTTGFTIDGNSQPAVNTTDVTPVTNGATNYGHFVAGVSYTSDNAIYIPSTCIYAEVLVKNIWRSPIALYNTYNNFSVNDMYNKIIVLLFGANPNGGTYLVTNTGTPISSIQSYGVTSLGNFMHIMRAIMLFHDGSTAYMDYITNQNVINQVNENLNFTIEPVVLHAVTEGTIVNPNEVCSNPGMSFMFINTKNKIGLTVDPTVQTVFNQNIGTEYLGMNNGVLSSTGTIKYNNSVVNMLTTKNGDLFGNSIYLGMYNGGTYNYNVLIILPEASFNTTPVSSTSNFMTLYSKVNSLFYVTVLAIPPTSTAITNANSTTDNSVYEFSPNVSAVTYNKVNMAVSNNAVV